MLPLIYRRHYTQHATPVSDTDDTDEEDAVGGLGTFSHGPACLTHQHWVEQLVVAGGFNVHNTESAESAHKVNMHLASLRARHLDANYTQSRMLTYTRWYLVFESLYGKPVPASRQFRPGLSALLNIPRLRHPLPRNFTTVSFQSTFVHHQVPLAGVEFLDLLCAQFQLPTTRRSYTHLQRLHFQIGLKCTREDRETFLATDARHDMLRLRGRSEDGNSFCCETICFVQIDNVKTLPRQRNDAPDRRVLVLVRWFSPHADSWERDSLRRPLCPGPLSINNCLWAYSRTPTPRLRCLVRVVDNQVRAFVNMHARLVGSTTMTCCWTSGIEKNMRITGL